jgi:hypothetical protein
VSGAKTQMTALQMMVRVLIGSTREVGDIGLALEALALAFASTAGNTVNTDAVPRPLFEQDLDLRLARMRESALQIYDHRRAEQNRIVLPGAARH